MGARELTIVTPGLGSGAGALVWYFTLLLYLFPLDPYNHTIQIYHTIPYILETAPSPISSLNPTIPQTENRILCVKLHPLCQSQILRERVYRCNVIFRALRCALVTHMPGAATARLSRPVLFLMLREINGASRLVLKRARPTCVCACACGQQLNLGGTRAGASGILRELLQRCYFTTRQRSLFYS